MNMFDEEQGGARLNPANCLQHLLLVWSVGYIDHSPTKYTVAGKPSDVVVVDVVDLDQADEQGYQGLVVRGAWWRNARLIGLLKSRIGRPKPILAWMMLGEPTMGNKPYELHFATDDAEAVARAEAWFAAHPDFTPTPPQARNPELERVQVDVPTKREPSQLERLAAAKVRGEGNPRDPHQALLRDVMELAQASKAPLPPPRPAAGSDIPDSEIPF